VETIKPIGEEETKLGMLEGGGKKNKRGVSGS
jgi:hypothetical protein